MLFQYLTKSNEIQRNKKTIYFLQFLHFLPFAFFFYLFISNFFKKKTNLKNIFLKAKRQRGSIYFILNQNHKLKQKKQI